MRALLLALAAGCFDPKLASHLRCESPDNWCPPPQQCGDDGFCSGGTVGPTPDAGGLPEGNLVFVSSETLPLTGTTTATAEAAADAKCQMLGQHLRSGTYMAWMGNDSTDAASRIPVDTGWARPDRLPFATSLADLTSDHTYYPPRLDDLMADASSIHLQTQVAADLNGGCISNGNLIQWGTPDGGLASWHHAGDVSTCDHDFYIYCLETDRSVHVAAPSVDPRNLYAFVTTNAYPVGNGLAQLDADCMAEASGVVAGTFEALAATTTAAAHSRFVPSTKAWTRGDGVIVALPTFAAWLAPLDTDVHGTAFAAHAADGSSSPTSNGLPGNNCMDWMSSATTSNVTLGDDTRSDGLGFQGALSGTCDQPQHLYCLEIP